MREFNALEGYPEPPAPRVIGSDVRTIHNRIIANQREKEFFDGDRNNGYGGLKYDGRWQPIAKNMCREYDLNDQSAVLQIECEKGFLLHDFLQIHPAMKVRGTETSDYALKTMMPSVRPHVQKASFTELPFETGEFDFVIAIGPVYFLDLNGAIKCLREIQRVGKGKSFITLGAYESEEELLLFRSWTLLGWTILSKTDWVEVLKYAGYTGDYKFHTAQSLKLVRKTNS